MTLLETRTQLVKVTGRYDLVVDAVAYADNGADFYINAGQLYLDRLETIHKSYSRVFETVTSGQWYKLFQLCRSLKSVWISNSDGEKWKLDKVDFDVLRAAYAEDPANIDSGDPLYYAPINIRRTPETASTITIDYFGATEYTEAYDHFEYNGLVFLPPADGTYTLELHGLFYQPKLEDDADTNYWTEVHPLVLVMAAARALEVVYRNTEGVKDWDNSIKAELFGMGLDLAEEEVAEISEMEG
ncbi:MAG: hypothetical protein KKH61_20525 [Gammaproteobacteria bacterium]|nr:hypothetical protein [Gammaproteobacteria bacterium]